LVPEQYCLTTTPQSKHEMSGMYGVSRRMEYRIELDAVMAAADERGNGRARRRTSAATDERGDGG
jgi:hypothetical protein